MSDGACEGCTNVLDFGSLERGIPDVVGKTSEVSASSRKEVVAEPGAKQRRPVHGEGM